MSAPAATLVPQLPATQHGSFLKKLGHLGLECATKVLPFLTKVAKNVEPEIDLLFPAQGAVFTSVVNSVCLAEVAGAQATANAPAGEAKFQAVWTAVGPQLLDLANQHGLNATDAEAAAKRYIDAVVQILNGPVKAVAPAPTSAV